MDLRTLLIICFIGATSVQLLYWLLVFSRLAFYKPKPHKQKIVEKRPVSVVICARNEYDNLRKNLPFFLNQDYPNFEIIVVNDNSFDKSLEFLLNLKRKNRILRHVDLKEATLPGKKAALSAGIKAAKHGIILVSDADCRPNSPHWIDKMQSAIQDKVVIGLGYSPYISYRGFLNVFIRFETVYTACQYFSFALVGLPYMGVGRNLVYTKSLFFEQGGFDHHKHIASGDDDLFINQAATGNNTNIILDSDAFVFSFPKRTWKGYYHQKSRHLTTGVKYKPVHKLLLGALSASHFLHYLCALLLLWYDDFSLISVFYLVRLGVVYLMYAQILKRLRDTSLLKWIPILDAVYIGYYLLFFPILLIGNRIIKPWT